CDRRRRHRIRLCAELVGRARIRSSVHGHPQLRHDQRVPGRGLQHPQRRRQAGRRPRHGARQLSLRRPGRRAVLIEACLDNGKPRFARGFLFSQSQLRRLPPALCATLYTGLVRWRLGGEERAVRSLLQGVVAAWSLLGLAVAPAHAELLPERVGKAAQERVDAGVAQTLVFGVVEGDKSEVTVFGKLDDGKAPDGDTVYEIGSITKTFTATLLAREVLAGRLTLETPVARLLDGFTVPSRNGKEITLGSIATQHSGLPRLPTNMAPADPDNPYADYDAAKLKAFLADYQLPRDPGASYEYSNLGFGLLGYALAQSQHGSYAALVGDGIFKPLGMTMTGLAFTDVMRAHLAPGHDDNGKPAKNWDIDALAGAGAI